VTPTNVRLSDPCVSHHGRDRNQNLERLAEDREMLSEILIEVVADGGSVSFMHPLQPEAAKAFWDGALAAAARDERIVLGAWMARSWSVR